MAARPYINLLAVRERAFSLLLNRRAGTKPRPLTELERIAAWEIAREHRSKKSKPIDDTKITADNAQEHLFSKIWRIVQSMNAAKDAPAPAPAPTILDAPIECSEPAQASNIVAYPPSAVLVSAPFSHAQLLDENLFAAKYHSQTTAAWKQSIRINEQIKREKERRSSAYQAAMRSKYG
jgi:hypothetical protein